MKIETGYQNTNLICDRQYTITSPLSLHIGFNNTELIQVIVRNFPVAFSFLFVLHYVLST